MQTVLLKIAEHDFYAIEPSHNNLVDQIIWPKEKLRGEDVS